MFYSVGQIKRYYNIGRHSLYRWEEKGYIKSYSTPSLKKERTKRTILGRWGEPNDLIGAAIFLASEASSYITGIDLIVDGGWTTKGL